MDTNLLTQYRIIKIALNELLRILDRPRAMDLLDIESISEGEYHDLVDRIEAMAKDITEAIHPIQIHLVINAGGNIEYLGSDHPECLHVSYGNFDGGAEESHLYWPDYVVKRASPEQIETWRQEWARDSAPDAPAPDQSDPAVE